ncbi:family 43 glycosylhydrolase [Ferruginibacter albus]|uniref:family 43 glycosylhydrolase n=1 Tax=Ferruginibacter albus TaxID=2875540 RepID=UPI001CC372FD|nr:family 43 glycosylhydrolase [Ferruginibacter albus]UAY51535.1 family 43 glycosylhydrolase [Ferruginibacter albus]
MLRYSITIVLLMAFANNFLFAQALPLTQQTTICNPLNLNYRFCLDTPSRREAADPTIINFKNDYFLFASKSGGYWQSSDLVQWKFIATRDLPLEDYAPTAVVVGDTVYFMASSGKDGSKIYKTADPASGKWQIANNNFPIGLIDPCLFLDDDGRLYLYYGCSNINPIYGIELDRKTLMPIGKPTECFNSHKEEYGWERSGDYNEKPDAPWIEGSWMTKHNGRYYLQYAAPGTQFKSYCDGMYVSTNPLGPFTLANNNPFSYKPEGFIAGAGHSSTFKDKYGNYWQASTMTISVKHMFERRIGLFPVTFDTTYNAYVNTRFGDYPFYMPTGISTQWMLLSYNKLVSASSFKQEHPPLNAVDENIRTYWSAKTGNNKEWMIVDLYKASTVNAIQLNFAEDNTKIPGRSIDIYYQYKIECSNDNKTWQLAIDKSLNKEDAPHDYMQFIKPIKARYWRIKNIHVPDGNFAISDFRIFGNGGGTLPLKAEEVEIVRDSVDRCTVYLKWRLAKTPTNYYVRYGTAKNKLYLNYEVLNSNEVTIHSLNKEQSYYFTIDSFNENGVQYGTKTIYVK